MSGRDAISETILEEPDSGDILRPLLEAPAQPSCRMYGTVIGELVAIANNGATPLVLLPNQASSAAIPAKRCIDLHGHHIGRSVVLMFEGGDTRKPIIMGVIRGEENDLVPQSGNVEVGADGERFLVTAKEQLVFRCGQASITLTKEGKVLIQGSYISSRSTGVNRVTGGSVQLN